MSTNGRAKRGVSDPSMKQHFSPPLSLLLLLWCLMPYNRQPPIIVTAFHTSIRHTAVVKTPLSKRRNSERRHRGRETHTHTQTHRDDAHHTPAPPPSLTFSFSWCVDPCRLLSPHSAGGLLHGLFNEPRERLRRRQSTRHGGGRAAAATAVGGRRGWGCRRQWRKSRTRSG